MRCHDCEEKENYDAKLPGSVVEIHNQEKLVFFRKIVIPATLGDDTVVVPEIGKYYNTLLAYEANGSVYLYSSDGIPTKLSTDIGELETMLEEEIVTREADDEGLRLLITEETAARIASMASIRDELNDASDMLGARIDSLSSSLSAETTARETADTMLREELADEAEARRTADETLTQSLSGEITNRGNAINALQTSLNNEISARQTADTALQETIDELPIPTRVSELTNDSGYQTAADVSEAVADAVGGISGFDYQVVTQLPATGTKGTIYLVSISGSSPNVYAEYIWVNNAWEQIGTTEVDLSGYATTAALNAGLAEKANISSLANVATSGSYNDLTNKPTIPTVNNGTLTIQKNGSSVATFTANSGTDVTANITASNITLTTTDPGEGSPLGNNEFVAVYGLPDFDSGNYSLNEVDTGDTWIDGKPIYKKTVNFGALPNTATKQVAHGITGLDLVIQTYGAGIRRMDGVRFPLPYVSGNVTQQIPYTVDNSNISLDTFMDRSGVDAYITIFYTKE